MSPDASKETSVVEQPERISTGNPRADHILGGGFPAHSINLVMGQPGTGKTVFVEQLAFHNADADRPVLFFTTLSEPLARVVTYLRGFSFFDEAAFGAAVVYDDIGQDLARQGTDILVPRIRDAIRTMSPRIIVIDSFRAIRDLSPSIADTHRLIHELAGLLRAHDTTAFLVGEYGEADIPRYPEFAVADAVVELSRRRMGQRDDRFFSVVKLRGSRYEGGTHAFTITDAGLQIFPRLVSPHVPEAYEPVLERVSTGVPNLDAMLGGGLWRGSATLLSGPSGSGKTTLGLQFAIEGTRLGEPSLFVNFQENPTQLARTIRGLQVDLDDVRSRGLELLYASTVELQIDSIVGDIFRRINERGIQRVVVDAIGDLAASASDPQRFHDYVYALVQRFTVHAVTSVLTTEPTSRALGVQLTGVTPLSDLCDNLIQLEMGGEDRTRRTIRVLKTRGSRHDPQVREVEIGSGGARIA